MSEITTYQPVWKKFLPVIVIKIKSAVKNGTKQQVPMDRLDFEKASSSKNRKYQFDLELNEGRTLRGKQTPTIAHDFARALNDHEVVKEIIRTRNFRFNLDSKFILNIHLNTPEEPVAVEQAPQEQAAQE
jgi:hypothetical protein